LETAANFAEQHAKHDQANYAAHYSLQARDKQFVEGDQVIALAPEGGGKLTNRWQGRGTILKVKSPHSYLIDMGNGSVRHVHANKVHKFVTRVQGCGVSAESDSEFGRVLLPVSGDCSSDLPSNRIDGDKLKHLDIQQRNDPIRLLDEFADCFVDKPGFCNVVTHHIVTSEEFVPKRMRPYRVPEALKSEVYRINELFEMGLIQPSLSPMASPTVCVTKKDGGIRIAVDYRYLNWFTVGDAFPMSTVNKTLLKLGNAKFISTFDTKSGYWQVPIAQQDR